MQRCVFKSNYKSVAEHVWACVRMCEEIWIFNDESLCFYWLIRDLQIFAEHFDKSWWSINEILTAVAGRSSVAAAGAVTVEGAPRLTAPPAVFTVTWRAPERKTETDNGRVCQEIKTYLGKFLEEKPQASSAPDCTGEQVSGRKPRLRARLRTKGKLPFLKRKISQGVFPCQVGRRRLLSKVNPFCKSCVRHRRSSWIATQPVAQKTKTKSHFIIYVYVCGPCYFQDTGPRFPP